MNAQTLLEDIKTYLQLQKDKKDIDTKMKLLQDKIRHQTLGQTTTKIGRYSVYWGLNNTRTINVAKAEELLSTTEFNKIISSSVCNKFKVGYR